ncbi:MAG: hypothetical protein J6K48_02305 [Lachnospiraceae bacterium]|nr:hypothetical protein [Lachnospiraceae bacterium]
MKKKDITVALILILIAVYLIANRLHLMPKIPIFTILFTVLFIYTAIRGFMRMHFFEGVVSLAIIGCIHDDILGIEAITPWTLIAAAVLIGIALDMIFKDGRERKDEYYFSHGEGHCTGHVENGADGEYVHVQNSFGTVSKYVNSDSFREANIENSFGTCNVYFDNAVLESARADIRIDNSFGCVNLYLPSTWRVIVKQDTAFGGIKYRGSGSNAEDAPVIDLRLDCSFGEICVTFE